MENILLLIIFSYPGALADMVYTFFAKDKSFYKETSEAFRVARDFFWGAVIALATMLLTIPAKPEKHTLSNWMSVLTTSDKIWLYIFVSLVIAIAFGGLWYQFEMRFKFPLKNKIRKKYKLAPESQYKRTWHDIVKKNDHVNIDECAVVIYNSDGKMIAAGLPRSVPDDIDDDPHFALAHCDTVLYELGRKKDSYLDGLRLVYCDVKTMGRIEFYDAGRLYAAIKEKQKEG